MRASAVSYIRRKQRNRKIGQALNNKNLMRSITNNRTLIGFGFTSLAYLVGYIKAIYFLKSYKIIINPLDVYSSLSVFVSGLTTILTGIVYPVVVISIGYVFAIIYPRMNKNLGIVIWSAGLTGAWLIFILLIRPLPPNLYVVPFTVYLTGLNNAWVGTCGIVIFTFIQIYLAFCCQRGKKYKAVLSSSLICWVALTVISQIAAFPHLSDEPIGIVNQSGMVGVIRTEHALSDLSQKVDTNSTTYFETQGLLISKLEQAYYFIPTSLKNGNEQSSLCIVPQSKFLGFQGKGR